MSRVGPVPRAVQDRVVGLDAVGSRIAGRSGRAESTSRRLAVSRAARGVRRESGCAAATTPDPRARPDPTARAVGSHGLFPVAWKWIKNGTHDG